MQLFIAWSRYNRTYDVLDEQGTCLFYGSAELVTDWLHENAEPTSNELRWIRR